MEKEQKVHLQEKTGESWSSNLTLKPSTAWIHTGLLHHGWGRGVLWDSAREAFMFDVISFMILFGSLFLGYLIYTQYRYITFYFPWYIWNIVFEFLFFIISCVTAGIPHFTSEAVWLRASTEQKGNQHTWSPQLHMWTSSQLMPRDLHTFMWSGDMLCSVFFFLRHKLYWYSNEDHLEGSSKVGIWQYQGQKVVQEAPMNTAQERGGHPLHPDTHPALGNHAPMEKLSFSPIHWDRSRGTQIPHTRSYQSYLTRKKVGIWASAEEMCDFLQPAKQTGEKLIAGHACSLNKVHLPSPYPAPQEKKLISYHISHFIYSASPRERPPHNDTKDISFIYCPSTCVFVSCWVAGKQTSVGTRRIEIVQWSLPSVC